MIPSICALAQTISKMNASRTRRTGRVWVNPAPTRAPTIAVGARQITDEMCTAAAVALHEATRDSGAVFPSIRQFRAIAQAVAVAVAKEAIFSGVSARKDVDEIEAAIVDRMWYPTYVLYRLMDQSATPTSKSGV